VLTFACGVVLAQATVQEPSPAPAVIAPAGSSTQVESRLASSFSTFAGSDDNARNLVTGLRQGSEITLTAPGAGGQPGESATFTPATRPMGYGNVRISLALAREELAQHGITQPTPEQLKAALAGGTVATGTGEPGTTARLPGVLQLRADGMGWGQIANSMGVKLGVVMSGRAAQPEPVAPTAKTAGSTATASGVTTAAGAASAQARGRGNGITAQQNARAGAGIVNASGGSGAGAGTGVHAGGRAGVVTGANVAAGSRASAAGLANGKGHARP
jgi:hypothetical protein